MDASATFFKPSLSLLCLISGYIADFTPRCSSDDRYSVLRHYFLMQRQGHHDVSITHAVTSCLLHPKGPMYDSPLALIVTV